MKNNTNTTTVAANTNTTIANDNAPVNAPAAAPAPAPVKKAPFKVTPEFIAEYRKHKKVADNFQAFLAALAKGDYRKAGEAAINGGQFLRMAELEGIRAQSWVVAKALNEASDADKTNEELAFAGAEARGEAEMAERAAKVEAAKTGMHCAFLERYSHLLANCTSEESRAKIKAQMAAEIAKNQR